MRAARRLFLQRAAAAPTRLCAAVGRFVSLFLPAMTAAVLAIIFFAFVFRAGWVWLGELVVYMHAVLFTAGAAYTLGCDEHVRIDVFYGRMRPRAKAIADLAGIVFLLVPSCGVILYFSFPYVRDSWTVLEHSPEGTGLPAVFILKSFILLMPAFLLMQGMAMAAKALLVLSGDGDGNGDNGNNGNINLPPAACGGGSEFSAPNGEGGGKLRGGGGRLLPSAATCHSRESGNPTVVLRAHSTPPENSPPTSSSGNSPTPPRCAAGGKEEGKQP